MSMLPSLRAVEIFPVDHEGTPHFCLYDPLGLAEHEVLLSQQAFFIAAQLDGGTDVEGVRAQIRAQFKGLDTPTELVLEVVNFLDANGFLMSDAFTERVRQVHEAYLASETRPAWHAGNANPEDAEGLDQYFLEMFAMEDGPGLMPAAPGAGPALRCLMVPHLDYPRGRLGYVHGYHRLYGAGKPDTVFIFGVAHAGAPSPFVATRKHFETPLGIVQVDAAALDFLEDACEWDIYEWELVHRTEHSVEFHAALLRWLYGDDVQIVPVLAAAVDGPEAEVAAAQFLAACQRYAVESGRAVTMLASADLAHVGKRFGDDFEIDKKMAQAIAERDETDLKAVLAGDATAWRDAVEVDDNARRVCGLGCTWGALAAMDPGRRDGQGEWLYYGQAADPAGGMVSYTAIALP